MQLILDSSILEHLLEQAATASRLAGHIDEPAVGPLADRIDEIVHVLSELLGNPHVVAAPVPDACSSLAIDIATYGAIDTQVVGSQVVALDVSIPGVSDAVPAAIAADTAVVSAAGAGGAR